MAATSMKLAGKLSVMAAARDADRPVLERLAQDLQHVARKLGEFIEKQQAVVRQADFAGTRQPGPPPIMPASEMVWCGVRNGLRPQQSRAVAAFPAMLWTLRGLDGFVERQDCGSIPASRFASMVLPEPGGPIIMHVVFHPPPPLRARAAPACPRTSRKSGARAAPAARAWRRALREAILRACVSSSTTSARWRTPNTLTPSTTAASAAFGSGRSDWRIPCSRAQTATDNAPRTGRMAPSSDNSPSRICRSSRGDGAHRAQNRPWPSADRTRRLPCARWPAPDRWLRPVGIAEAGIHER